MKSDSVLNRFKPDFRLPTSFLKPRSLGSYKTNSQSETGNQEEGPGHSVTFLIFSVLISFQGGNRVTAPLFASRIWQPGAGVSVADDARQLVRSLARSLVPPGPGAAAPRPLPFLAPIPPSAGS